MCLAPQCLIGMSCNKDSLPPEVGRTGDTGTRAYTTRPYAETKRNEAPTHPVVAKKAKGLAKNL